MNQIDKTRSFYSQRYRKIAGWVLEPGKKIILGNQENQVCRFCGQRSPVATFQLSAHAIPEAIGNKSLFSAHECDACNALFGNGIENDFGNWSKPMRTLARIRGKNGIPSIKRETGGWRFDYEESDGFKAFHYRDDPNLGVEAQSKQVLLQLKREPYIPVAVFKAFVKMGLSVMPEAEMPHFVQTVDWICTRDHRNATISISTSPLIYTFAPELMPNDKITVSLIRRKDDGIAVPYAYLILAYGNEMFQVRLPALQRDQALTSDQGGMPPFPHPSARFESHRHQLLDLSGCGLVHDEIIAMPLGCDRMEKPRRFEAQEKFAGYAEQATSQAGR
jgi:HNH endonuclease